MGDLKEVRILLFGKVQMQAFRKHIRELAVKNELFGYVQNMKDYKRSAEVVCQGEEDKIALFIKELEELKETKKTAPMLAKVERVESRDREPTIKYTDFDILRRDDEMGERFDEGVEQIIKLRTETSQNFEKMDNKYGTISGTMEMLVTALASDRKESRDLARRMIETQNKLVDYITSKK